MQESLFKTVQKLQNEQKINVEELELILNSSIEEVVSLCKKACLKPKTDSMGNAYFTKDDVNMLKKIKELYSPSQFNRSKDFQQKTTIEQVPKEDLSLDKADDKINFLTKAKNRALTDYIPPMAANSMFALSSKLEDLENNLISKMSEILSEKMDGFDEIIVELIRSKTENENLRQQINSLNKQVYVLKKELASYYPLALGLYAKKDNYE